MPGDHGRVDPQNQFSPIRDNMEPGAIEDLLIDRISNSDLETGLIVHEFFKDTLQKLRDGAVLLLEGELGAGKTAFCRYLGREFGITEPVNSPTFNLLLQHRGEGGVLYHYDLYRLDQESMEEMEFADLWENTVEDRFTIHAIEWWQKAGFIHSRLPVFRVHLTLDPESPENRRRIRIYRRTV